MFLEHRPPSANWEPVSLDPTGLRVVWAWFRPASVPSGLIVAVPAALFQDAVLAPRLSIRQLIAAAGLDPAMILCWVLNGMQFDAMAGTSPLLDQPLPPPQSDGNLEVSVWMAPLPQPAWAGYQMPMYGQTPDFTQQTSFQTGGSDSDQHMLGVIETYWNDILQLEVRIGSIRKELSASLSRMNSLNRDLNADERCACDSKDIQEWTDARRWLRDSISVLSRSVKEIDVGTTSGAGKRHRFEEIYQQQVVPKIPFEGLAQAVNEFESYRKTVQNVLASAQGGLSRAGRDAEQRASSVLRRVAAKVRSHRRG
jgi:hypothetical protein